MSYTITLAGAKMTRPALDGVTCEERGTTRLLAYREGISSRGVEVSIEGNTVRARLVALAATGDWALAFEYLAACAGEPAPTVEGEDGTTGTSGAFADVIVRESAAALAGAEAAISTAGAELRLRGPIREVHIGRRMLGELLAPRAASMIERVRRIQYLEREGYEVVSPVPLSAPGVPTFAVWSPARNQAFEPVEALGVTAPGGNLYVPVNALASLLGERFEWLDEKQFAIAGADDPGLLERARAVSIDPYRAVKKKWWQFWKSE